MLKEIQQKIEQFSRKEKQAELVAFLKEALKNQSLSAQDLYDYSESYCWASKSAKVDYVIRADTINLLGVVIDNLFSEAEMPRKFYKLAAERGSNWGGRNYANAIAHENLSEALAYLKTAIELSAPQEKNEFQLLQAKLLWKNHAYREANLSLNAYLNYQCQRYYENKQAHLSALKQGIALSEKRLSFYQKAIEKADPTEIEDYLEQLLPFLTGRVVYLDLYRLSLSVAAYLTAKLHERLGQYPQAMQAYARVKDPHCAYYDDSVTARRKLLHNHATTFLQSTLASTDVDQLAVQADQLSITVSSSVACEVSEADQVFRRTWQRGANGIDFVDAAELNRLYDEMSDPLWDEVRERQNKIQTLEKPFAHYVKKPLLPEVAALQAEIEPLVKTCRHLEEQHKHYSPEKREVLRRHLSEKTFFAPPRNRKKEAVSALSTELIRQRYNLGNNHENPIDLTDVSSRRLITAEAVFQSATVDLMALNAYDQCDTLGFPIKRSAPWRFDHGVSGENTFGPVESYRCEATLIGAEHRANPKFERLGTSYVHEVGTYNAIFKFLNTITKGEPEKEQSLAAYFIRYGRKHHPLSLEELVALNPAMKEQDVHAFNRICFLIMEKEQAQWHTAVSDCYHLGMTVSQARCMILLKEGVIRFADVFPNGAKYGVYSQNDLLRSPGSVAQACKEIDLLYKKHLSKTREAPSVFFPKPSQSSDGAGDFYGVLTRKQARADLSYVYGGDSDTDGEGYESDISISSRP